MNSVLEAARRTIPALARRRAQQFCGAAITHIPPSLSLLAPGQPPLQVLAQLALIMTPELPRQRLQPVLWVSEVRCLA